MQTIDSRMEHTYWCLCLAYAIETVPFTHRQRPTALMQTLPYGRGAAVWEQHLGSRAEQFRAYIWWSLQALATLSICCLLCLQSRETV